MPLRSALAVPWGKKKFDQISGEGVRVNLVRVIINRAVEDEYYLWTLVFM